MEQNLLQRLQITDREIERRKDLLGITATDIHQLSLALPIIESNLETLVGTFFTHQLNQPEVVELIDDAETLDHLRISQAHYILDLFCGCYDEKYVSSRLRIGLIHKRMGIDTKFYLASVQTLKTILINEVCQHSPFDTTPIPFITALEKVINFDTGLVLDTYIDCMMNGAKQARKRAERYAEELELKVKERTRLLGTDPVTGLQNVRYLLDTFNKMIQSAQRRQEPLSFVYIDINDFKLVNDKYGHQRGDEILRQVGEAIKSVSRIEDASFRYGGDEFCVILPNCTEGHALTTFCTRLIQELKQRVPTISLSVGAVQTGPTSYHNPKELIDCADKRMYGHKNECKNRIYELQQ
ncbi:GGDEF domain-containing protein [Parasalinivibrio latis]